MTADSEEEAVRKFLAGEDTSLIVSEVTGTVVESSIVRVTQESDV